ncbi:uncharacterized protein [Aegilops tauschii subsp. strangulata]|uniref:uncharacterized protein isoform X2 n=1 Tax=Aegilops tauschii subsp. strangulata TaxID=200361 RepID=UPI000989BC97
MEVVAVQTKAIADKIEDQANVVVAHKPVWAIGTGKVAPSAQAHEEAEGGSLLNTHFGKNLDMCSADKEMQLLPGFAAATASSRFCLEIQLPAWHASSLSARVGAAT